MDARRALLTIAKYAFLIMGGLALSMIVVSVTAKPVADRMLGNPGGAKIVTGPNGERRTVYDDEHTPEDYDEALRAGSPELIYENQERLHRDEPPPQVDLTGMSPMAAASQEDRPDRAVAPPGQRRDLQRAARAWVERWERFEVGESDAQYAKRLRPMAAPGRLGALVDRSDNKQNSAISRDGTTGSRLVLARKDPADSMAVLAYDQDRAYVSVVGAVQYTGPSTVWSGQVVYRSYSILFERHDGDWKVVRSAAQTLGRAPE